MSVSRIFDSCFVTKANLLIYKRLTLTAVKLNLSDSTICAIYRPTLVVQFIKYLSVLKNSLIRV